MEVLISGRKMDDFDRSATGLDSVLKVDGL
jgi:hypothetical protein